MRAKRNSRVGGAAEKLRLLKRTNPRWLDLNDDWEQEPKVYDRAWKIEEMI